MKKSFIHILILVLFIALSGSAYAKPSIVKCNNGTFIGGKAKNTNVVTFKGIPYAKKPIGNLRWKVPVDAPDSNKIHLALKYNTIALQTQTEEDFEHFKTSEDCLRLNIWTKNLKGKKKPVMVYFHGGSYGWEGTPLSIYDAQYLANEYDDIIVVTVDYRVNIMGFADFSNVDGGGNFKEAPFLGILDCISALRWVNKNIEAFGGDPKNVTIFGESAGGGIVSSLMTIKEAQGLFKRVIAQSGTLNLTSTRESFNKLNQTKEFMDATGTKNMDELMALTSKQIEKGLYADTDTIGTEGASGVANLNNFPLRGENSIIPADPYKTLLNGMSKDIDFMIGTTADELRYWISLMGEGSVDKNIEKFNIFIEEKAKLKDNNIQKEYLSITNTPDDKYSQKYEDIWKNTELANDIWFRYPSIKMAENHIKSQGKGKTYLYYFGKKANGSDWRGAAHAIELPYVFYNVNYSEYGSIDKELAKKISNMWVNFARTGNPDTEDIKLIPYDLKDRSTIVIDNDGKIKNIKDFKGAQRKLLEKAKL